MRYEYGKRSENTQTQPGSPLAARTGTSGTVSDTLTPETERATGPSPQPDACRTRDTEGRHAPPAQYVRPRQRSRTRALGSHRSTLRYKEATRPAGVQRQRSKRRLSSWVSPPLPHPSLHMSRITLAVPAVLARGGLRAPCQVRHLGADGLALGRGDRGGDLLGEVRVEGSGALHPGRVELEPLALLRDQPARASNRRRSDHFHVCGSARLWQRTHRG